MEVISIKLANWSGGSAFSTATLFSLNSLLHPMSTPHLGQECLSHLVMSSFSDYIFLSVQISYFISLLSFWTLSDLLLPSICNSGLVVSSPDASGVVLEKKLKVTKIVNLIENI